LDNVDGKYSPQRHKAHEEEFLKKVTTQPVGSLWCFVVFLRRTAPQKHNETPQTQPSLSS
jgi:hypothetical protein